VERFVNDLQGTVEKIIWRFLEANKELVLRRIIGSDGLSLIAGRDKDIRLDTVGAGKALYNGVELGSAGVGGDFLPITGGTLLGDLSMGGNRYINNLPTGRNWDLVTDDQVINKSDIIGAGGFMQKAQTPGNNWYFQYGLRLPQGTDAAKSAAPAEGQVYWATDTDKLYIGKGSDQWGTAGGGSAIDPVTGKIWLNEAHTAWMIMNGNILEFHVPGGKWRVVPEP